MRVEPTSVPTPVAPGRRWPAAHAAYLILQVATGLLFMMHGLQKLFGFFGGLGNGATAPLASKIGVAGGLELLGGLLLALGLFTRPVALVLAGEMVIAYVTAHLPRGVIPLQNGGEVALLYAVIFVFLALTPRPRD
jgi:putative oxidoreductase